MPTLPPAPPPPPAEASPPAGEPHRLRRIAESFGVDTERYDRTRPGYPEALVRRIIAASPSPSPDVLDVGPGTGIEARLFRAAGCRVLGVEPDARMADFARRSAGIEVEVATFEAWDPAGRDFDAVVAGTSWHWVDPDVGAGKAARVLRPGGRLAAFWNAREFPPEAREGFAEVYQRLAPGSLAARGYGLEGAAVDSYSNLCRMAADGIRNAGGFGEPEQWRFDWQQDYTRDEWLDQVPTHGDHTQFPPAQLGEILAGLAAVLDRIGGGFTIRYSTVVVTAARTGAR